MRSSYQHFVIAAAAILLAMAFSVMVLLPRTHVEVGNQPLRVAVVVMTAFLVLTIVRYLVFMWLGYLHHIEAKTRVDDGERFEPLVTILVPAYNEEAVI